MSLIGDLGECETQSRRCWFNALMPSISSRPPGGLFVLRTRGVVRTTIDGTVALRSQGLLPSTILLSLVAASILAGVCLWFDASALTVIGLEAISLVSGYVGACTVAILNEQRRAAR